MTATSLTPSPVVATSPVWRDLLLALVVGALCYALSCALVAPGSEAQGFGIEWDQMSEAPLELRGRLPHRLLAPFLAHVVGMGKPHYLLFVRGLSIALLAVVFFFCRRRGARVVDASLITAAVAVTAAVQMYKQHWVGYPDALGYALFFGNVLAAKRPVVFWSLFLVNLLNHELAVFLLPWLWFVRREADRAWRTDVVAIAACLASYGAFYLWVKSAAPQQVFNAEYFAEHPLFPGGTVVVWSLTLVNYVVAFGPILAVLAWHQHRGEHGRERWHLWLVGAGMAAIFCIAFDWARHCNLIIIPLVFASLRFLAAGHRAAYLALLVAGVVAMIIVPPWAPKSWPTHLVVDPAIVPGIVVVDPGGAPGQLNISFGPLSEVLRLWLPEAWPTLWPILAIGAAIWLVGWWLARRDRATT
jgi:hypothetical protein